MSRYGVPPNLSSRFLESPLPHVMHQARPSTCLVSMRVLLDVSAR